MEVIKKPRGVAREFLTYFFPDDLLLSLNQARSIERVLKVVCVESRQKVNTSKSKLFVSSNTYLNLVAVLSEQFQIPSMENLGVYLGVPLIHGRIKSKHFGFLLEKIRRNVHG